MDLDPGQDVYLTLQKFFDQDGTKARRLALDAFGTFFSETAPLFLKLAM